jgi:hypothetical protein
MDISILKQNDRHIGRQIKLYQKYQKGADANVKRGGRKRANRRKKSLKRKRL